MKIALITRWGATCGVSFHAEAICREFLKLGVKVVIYAPTLESACRDWHHVLTPDSSVESVYRVYSETSELEYPYGGWVDEHAIACGDYDAIVIEGYSRLPVVELSRVLKKLGNKPVVTVLHTGYPRDAEPLLKLLPNKYVVVFDERYCREVVSRVDYKLNGMVRVIPYPVLTDYIAGRRELSDECYKLFSFGRQPISEYYDYIHVARKLSQELNIKYHIIRCRDKIPVNYSWLVQETRILSLREILESVANSHIHLIPKSETKAVVVSSTVAQTIYAGTPTIVPDTRYFETIPTDENGFGAVVKYRLGDLRDLYSKIKKILLDESVREMVVREAMRYALENSCRRVAMMMLELIKEALEESGGRVYSRAPRVEVAV